MSRDFTPYESYQSSLVVDKNLNLFDKATTVINGKAYPMISKHESKIRHKYPYLARANGDILKILAKRKQMDIVEYLNSNIKKIVEKNNQEIDKTIEKWFHGRLDENFHDNTQNDEALMNYLNSIFN